MNPYYYQITNSAEIESLPNTIDFKPLLSEVKNLGEK